MARNRSLIDAILVYNINYIALVISANGNLFGASLLSALPHVVAKKTGKKTSKRCVEIPGC